jgi:heme oxygenase
MAHSSPGLMSRLRSETRDLHDRIEAVSFHRRLANAQIDLDEYGTLLAAMLVIHEAHEQLRLALPEALQALSAPLLALSPSLRLDLADIGLTPPLAEPCLALEAARAYGDRLRRQVLQDPLVLLGHLYVCHGSLLGGFHLRPLFVEALGFGDEQLRYFGGLGTAVPQAWRGFRQAMDTHPFPEDEQDRIVEAACEAFRELIGVYEAFADSAAVEMREVS